MGVGGVYWRSETPKGGEKRLTGANKVREKYNRCGKEHMFLLPSDNRACKQGDDGNISLSYDGSSNQAITQSPDTSLEAIEKPKSRMSQSQVTVFKSDKWNA